MARFNSKLDSWSTCEDHFPNRATNTTGTVVTRGHINKDMKKKWLTNNSGRKSTNNDDYHLAIDSVINQ